MDRVKSEEGKEKIVANQICQSYEYILSLPEGKGGRGGEKFVSWRVISF